MDLTVLSALIEKHEGRRNSLYKDSMGKWTIGVGHNIGDFGVSNATVDQMLREDIQGKINDLNRLIPWWISLDDVRRMILVDMSFNVGSAGLMGFKKFLQATFAMDFRTAAAEMLSSEWATQVGSRADDLARMMISGSL